MRLGADSVTHADPLAQVHYYLPNAVELGGIHLTKQRKQELIGNGQRLTDDAALAMDQATYASDMDCRPQSINGNQVGQNRLAQCHSLSFVWYLRETTILPK